MQTNFDNYLIRITKFVTPAARSLFVNNINFQQQQRLLFCNNLNLLIEIQEKANKHALLCRRVLLIGILLGTLLKFLPGAPGTLPINFEFESHGRGSWSLYYSVR